MIVFDLKTFSSYGQTFIGLPKGLANAQRSISILTTDGFLAETRIQQMYPALSRQPSYQDFFLSRSVPLYGICTTYFSPLAPRHRNLFAGRWIQVIPFGIQGQSLKKHSRRSQRKTIMVNIRRLRTGSDPKSKTPIQTREFRYKIGAGCLRTRFNHH